MQQGDCFVTLRAARNETLKKPADHSAGFDYRTI